MEAMDWGMLAVPVIVALLVLALMAVIYLVVNSRYPKVQFLVFEGNTWAVITQRTMGDKVVNSDLITILIRGHKLIGEDIKNFQYGYLNGKKTYLATLYDQALIPLKINDPGVANLLVSGNIFDVEFNQNAKDNMEAAKTATIKVKEEIGDLVLAPISVKNATVDPVELGLARDIATRYINVIEQTKEDLKKYNELLATIISLLPFIIIMFVVVVAFVFIVPPIIDKMDSILESAKTIATSHSCSIEQGSRIANSTVGNPPIFGGG